MPEQTEAIGFTTPSAAAFGPFHFSWAKLQAISGASWGNIRQTLPPMARRAQYSPFPFYTTPALAPLPPTPGATFRLLIPSESYGHEAGSRLEKLPESISSFDDRIEELQKEAELEGNSINATSKASFLEFFRRYPLIRRDRLVLMENGNLRAVWKGESGAHIGLQFLNTQSLQYVIFKHRQPSLPVSRVYGRDTMDGIMRQIHAFDLESLLYP